MELHRFDQTVSAFTAESQQVKSQLSDMLDLIVSGRAPEERLVADLDRALAALNSTYQDIQTQAGQLLSQEELPVDGAPVPDYTQAVEHSRQRRVQQQVERAAHCLKQFTAVRSMVEAYAQALAPLQQEAAELLAQLEQPDGDVLAQAQSQADRSQVFLDAMVLEDPDSPEGLALFDTLDELYPRPVVRGLARGAYFIPDAPGADIAPAPTAAPTELAVPADADHTPVQAEPIPDTPAEEPTPVLTEEPSAPADEPELLAEQPAAATEEETVPDTPQPTEEPAAQAGPDVPEELVRSRHKLKNANPSASAFKSMLKSMPRASFTLLPLFSNLGPMTEPMILDFCQCLASPLSNPEVVSSTLAALVSKNCLADYVLERENGEEEIVYGLTSYGRSCMLKDTIHKLPNWRVSPGKHPFAAQSELPVPALRQQLTLNAALARYLTYSKAHQPEDVYTKVQGSISWMGIGYQVAVFWDDDLILCRLVAAGEPGPAALPEQNDVLVVLLHQDAQPPQLREGTRCFVLDQEDRLSLLGDDQPAAEETAKPDILPQESTPEEPLPADQGVEPPAQEETPAAEQEPAAEPEPLPDTAEQAEESFADHCRRLIDNPSAPSDEELEGLILDLITQQAVSDQPLIQAALLAKAASFSEKNVRCGRLYRQMLLATRLPLDEVRYSGVELEETFPQLDPDHQGLILAAYLYALLSPAQAYDYTLQAKAEQLLRDYESWFPDYPQVKALFHTLCSIERLAPGGFSDVAISRLGSEEESQQFLQDLQSKAASLMAEPVIKAKMNGIPEFLTACFGRSSDLRPCMDIIQRDAREEKELVLEVLKEFSQEHAGNLEIQQDLIDQFIDRQWGIASKGKTTSGLKLQLYARRQIVANFQQRLDVMYTWVSLEDHTDQKKLDALKRLQTELLRLIPDAIQELLQSPAPDCRVVLYMLGLMERRLEREKEDQQVFFDLLYTGILSLDEDWKPIMDPLLDDVRYYEPWRNVLRHIIAPRADLEEVRQQIFDPNSPMFDNLSQLSHIDQRLGLSTPGYDSADETAMAVKNAENVTQKFQDKLELAYAYNQIDETTKEQLATILADYRDTFFSWKDFGCWRQFLQTLERQIDQQSAEKERKLRKTLQDRRDSLTPGQSGEFLDMAQQLLDDTGTQNFAVAEEYVIRFDNGEDPQQFRSALHETDNFQDFLSDAVFTPLYHACHDNNGKALRTFGTAYLEQHMPSDWTTRQKDDCLRLINNWPARRDASTPSQIKALFTALGLTVKEAVKVSGKKEELYQLFALPTEQNLSDYSHPIAAFGTQIKPDRPIPVVVLYGNRTDKELVDTVTSMNLGQLAIVLLDRPLARAKRRKIAEIFYTETSRQNSFLLIDQVLLLYLALHQVTERLPAMLKCTLPYTAYQPFIWDGGSVPDEMFCGRLKELASITDPNGACVVYGGRQLGKTALLQRAESLCSKPGQKSYAVYCSIIGCQSEEDFVLTVVTKINEKSDLSISRCTTIHKLCEQLGSRFRSGKISSFLLLLDEADDFLESISSGSYRAIQPLIDLKRDTKNSFKFVLAGLHNVCRAKNATAQNGVFGQLGTPLCIKPLSPVDALQLLSKPLRYLGFRLDRQHQLETILANTNYYPGILHFFGYTLLQALTSRYGQYYQAANGNPPYTLRDEQLGAVMNSEDLNQSIKGKFRMSLNMDARYFMLARCVAMLYHYSAGSDNANWVGYTVQDIRGMAEKYNLHCLADISPSGYTQLLDEMVEMGILSRPQKKDKYRLRRNSFLDIIGPDMDQLDEKINYYNDHPEEKEE